MIKDKGFVCKYIILKKLFGVLMLVWVILVSIFNVETVVARVYLKEWIKDAFLGVDDEMLNMCEMVDWEYYKMCFVGVI